MKTLRELLAMLSRRPASVDPPRREGWPPLPDTPQQRRRKSDPRPWRDVRPSDHTDDHRERPR